MVIFTSPREVALAAQLRSGHYLAMRQMPASSVGPEHQTVWQCGPQQRYARYFASNDSAQTTQRDIECSWDGSHSLRVGIVPDVLDWRIEPAPTPASVLTAAIGRRLKSSTSRSKTFQRAVGPVAPCMLRTRRVGVGGTAPNGQRSTSALPSTSDANQLDIR